MCVSCGVWHQEAGSKSFGSCGLLVGWVGPQWILLVLMNTNDNKLEWDLRSLEANSMPGALCCVPRAIPEQIL